MTGRLLRVACSAGLVFWAAAAAASPVDIGSPMHCTTYTVGADTHTQCSPGPSSPPAAAFTCYDYTVGTDTHAACSPVPATRLAPLRGRIAAPPAAASPHCYTYRIGTSTYTECR